MTSTRILNVVGVHCAGEVGGVITGGVRDVPGKTMYEKMRHFWDKEDHIRQLLLNEPRGTSAMCMNLVLAPCNPEADAGFIIMEHEEYPPMSGSNTIATTTALLETGMVPMREPTTTVKLDTPAGLVTVEAECEGGKCKSVHSFNVPSFVFGLDIEVNVPGIGDIKVDIAYGGMIYALVDAASVGLKVESEAGAKLVEVGEKIKKAVQEQTNPIHPENPGIRGVSILEFTEPPSDLGDAKSATNTVVISPGHLDRSPCGTGTCARLAVLHARGQIAQGQAFHHRSVIETEFIARIHGTTKVGGYDAVCPSVKGSAWMTSLQQVLLHPTDPFPEGFRVGDKWHLAPAS